MSVNVKGCVSEQSALIDSDTFTYEPLFSVRNTSMNFKPTTGFHCNKVKLPTKSAELTKVSLITGVIGMEVITLVNNNLISFGTHLKQAQIVNESDI